MKRAEVLEARLQAGAGAGLAAPAARSGGALAVAASPLRLSGGLPRCCIPLGIAVLKLVHTRS